MIIDCRYSVEAYRPEDASRWDEFVAASRNATFILQRPYLDYHVDRFADQSLIIYRNDNGRRRLVALFAACEMPDGSLCAHGGLTYGGLVLPYNGVDGSDVVEIMSAVAEWYKCKGYNELRYKAVPYIYHRYPSDEDIYALFRSGARLEESNLSSCIDLTCPVGFNENSRRNMRRASGVGVTVGESDDYSEFWGLLEKLLADKYQTRPVHTLDEIRLLASRFPDNIKLFTARNSAGKVIAGTVLYITPMCVHAQYIGASPEGKDCGALALLFSDIIAGHTGNARYFDFGISNEDHGLYLNEGLLRQKYGFGARGVTYNIYTVEL